MRIIFLTALLAASCTRVDSDILVDADRSLLVSVSDGSEIFLTVNTNEFQSAIDRLSGIFIVGVFDNSSDTYFQYTYPSLDGSQFPELESIHSGQSLLRFQMQKVSISEGEPEIVLEGLRDDSSSICVGLHFADVGRVLRSERICVKE